jgi:hypothetical protein
MYGELNHIQLNAEKRKLEMERGAKARLLKRIKAGQPGFKCTICEKLATMFLGAAKKLKALAENKTQNDFPPIKSEDLHRLLENPTSDGLFV